MVSGCGGARTVPLRYRDAFCLFESGRLFYCFSMFPEADGGGKGVAEYVLIAMQRLALARPDPEAVRRWRFSLAGKPPVSLTHMAQDRLAMLVAGGGGGGAEPNGLRAHFPGPLGLTHTFPVGRPAV